MHYKIEHLFLGLLIALITIPLGAQSQEGVRMQMNQGNYSNAIILLEALEVVYPGQYSDELRMAKECLNLHSSANANFNNQDYDAAESLYNELLKINPNDRNSRQALNKCKEEREKYLANEFAKCKTISDYRVFTQRFPNAPQAIEARAKVVEYEDAFLNAEKSFRAGIYDQAAKLCEPLEKNDEVKALQEKALQCSRLHIEMNTLESYGLIEGVLDKAKAILELNPNDVLALEVMQKYRPKQETYGIVEVSSTPPGATIWLDGEETKLTTPNVLEDILPGEHSILLVMKGYSDYSSTITVTEGKREELYQKLNPLQNVEETVPSSKTTPLIMSSTTTGVINGHEWVDLGLSVKWATCNLGASIPSDYGSYYAWAEISEKNRYGLSNLRYYTGDFGANGPIFSKYNTISGYGPVDYKSQLEAFDDAARETWGNSWRIPSNAEIMELLEKCTWTWTTQGGKRGYEVKSKVNGNSIFLPAAGYRDEGDLFTAGFHGYYWSSSLYSYIPDYAWLLFFSLSDSDEYYSNRRYGFSIRPVTE